LTIVDLVGILDELTVIDVVVVFLRR